MPAPTPEPSGPVERAARYQDQLDRDHRKQRGVWFTPMALALPTAHRALAPLLADRGDQPLRICDPAVGGGTFLLAALQVLTAAGERPERAGRGLCGLDLDATAANLAAEALAAAGAPATDVRAGDGLLELTPGTFDAVLTNPPWTTLQADAAAPARVAALRPRFRHQGRGKLYTYRLFIERAWQLLRPGGRFGLIVPASLWFDRDAEPLRRLLLDECRWEWLFGFENRKRLFAIDSRYRFAAIVGTKGGRTRSVRVAFARTDAADWAVPQPPHVRYGRRVLARLSPRGGTFVECEEPRDLALLARMAHRGRPLLGAGGPFDWRQGDFNMTGDRSQFVPRDAAERAGYRRDDDAVWRCAGREDLLPLYQGAMVYDLHPNVAAHAGGTGHATRWVAPADPAELRPVFLVAAAPWRATAARRPPARLVLRALSNASNERTAVACLLPDVPCGNSLGVLTPRATAAPLRQLAAGAAMLGSLPFDWALRQRLSGTNLNRFVLEDCVLPPCDAATERELARLALALCAVLPWHGELWRIAAGEGWLADDDRPAGDAQRRRDLSTRIDVLVGNAFGLTARDVARITRDCDAPAAALRRQRAPERDPRGFWRIDRTLPAAERRPNRWRAAVAPGVAAPR